MDLGLARNFEKFGPNNSRERGNRALVTLFSQGSFWGAEVP